jgi:beta-glucosidase
VRGELGFQGIIVSDYGDIIRLHTWQGIADSPKEAVRVAVDAGLDMSMVPMDYSFNTLLTELVKEGKITEKRLDESVRRILKLKYETGLFKNPYVEKEAVKNFGKPEYRQTALQAANEVMTLLKNTDNTLPLAKNRKVLVVGPGANSITALNGCWSYTWQGNDAQWYPKNALTIAGAVREKIGDAQVTYRQGVDFSGKVIDVDQAVADAKNADVVLLCLGEDAYAETPGDINDLDLPAGQQELAKKLYATGKTVILVLTEGRGRIIREIEPQAKGILLAYWPGIEGARAIANVLFGDVNPSGKLPFTYTQHSGNLLTYDRKFTNRLNESSAPGEFKIDTFGPQYELGYGLSYTTFDFKNLKLSAPTFKGSGKLTVSVEVTNTGKLEGKEVVELYSHDLFASLTQPLRRLRAFKKINLKPGETSTVSFEITKDDLAFVNGANKTVTEPGDFEIIIGQLKANVRYED